MYIIEPREQRELRELPEPQEPLGQQELLDHLVELQLFLMRLVM